MRKKRLRRKRIRFLVLLVLFVSAAWLIKAYVPRTQLFSDGTFSQKASETISQAQNTVSDIFDSEPQEVRELRLSETPETDSGHQEYYFSLLGEDEQKVYREMLTGIRNREKEFYLTMPAGEGVDRAYHALLNDHPELFWIHNREKVYTTAYSGADYCRFSPGYSYTDQEIAEIQAAMENAFQEVSAQITEGADTYEKVRVVYAYLIDYAEYVSSDDDQSIAGIFWKRGAVCAGYARAVQYLLERLEIPCIYVEGDTKNSDEGHAWNIVQIDGQYYYVDVTNGDQPQFLEGDAAQLAEHKTILYDYLCPFPEEYEQIYTPSADFPVPDCTARDKNFYVLNQGCFDSYSRDTIYNYCCMRINNGAAVIRFKFSSQEAFDQACDEWVYGNAMEDAAQYYMQAYGMNTVQYHYGILENMKTIYFMF